MNSALEQTLLWQLKVSGLPEPAVQYKFSDRKKWRADLAYPAHRILIECVGGTWTRGAHVRGAGVESDCRKTNAAQLAGYLVLQFTTDMVKSGEAVTVIEEALSLRIFGKEVTA